MHSWRNGFSKDALSVVLDYLEKDVQYPKEEYADFSAFMISAPRPFVFEEFDEADSVGGLASCQLVSFANFTTDLFVGGEGGFPVQTNIEDRVQASSNRHEGGAMGRVDPRCPSDWCDCDGHRRGMIHATW